MNINKNIPRVMRSNAGQYLAMILLSLLSVLMFVMLTLTAQNLQVAKNSYETNNVREDLGFYSTTTIDNIPDIENRFDLKIEGSYVREYEFGEKSVRLFTANEKVNIPAVIEGKLPSVGEIAFDPAFAKANNFKVGDSFEMDGKKYTVSGIITLPNYSYILKKSGDFVNNPELFGIGILADEDLSQGIHLYSVKYNNLQENVYEQAKPFKAYLNAQGIDISQWEYAKYNLKISVLDIQVKAISLISVMIPTVFMLITALLIAIVQNKMIRKQAKIIGTLYALGYRRKELIAHYLGYPIIIALLGGLIGGLLGMVLLKPGMGVMLGFFSVPIGALSYNPIYLVIGIIMSGAIFCLGSYISLRNIFKHSPAQLMSNKEKVKKINFLERKLKLEGLPFKRKFAIREQLRSIPRLVFLIAGVVIATFFMMYGFIGQSSFDVLLNPPESDIFHSKVEYVFERPQTGPVPAGGEPIAGWHMIMANNFSDSFELAGITENSELITLKDRKGNPLPVQDDMVVISSTMVGRYGLDIGKNLSFVDIINDNEYTVQVTHIADIDSGDFVFTSLGNFNKLMGWENGAYNAIIAQEPLSVPGDMIYKIKTPESTGLALEKYTLFIRYSIYGIAAVAFALGLIILYIIASINIEDNKSHISLMKVFGYRAKEINAMLLNYSRILVVIGYVIGVPVGYMIVKLIFSIIEMFDISMAIYLKPIYLFAGFVIIVLTFEATKLLCARRIARIPLSEALKVQNE